MKVGRAALVPELPLNMIVTWIKLLKLTEHKFFHI